MTMPTSFYPWAVLEDTFDFTFNGVTHTVNYKTAPVVGDPAHDFTEYGILFKTRVPVQYINWQMNGAYRWIEHINQRLVTGDVYLTTEVETVSDINEQLGGTWVYQGAVSKPWGNQYYWKKTS